MSRRTWIRDHPRACGEHSITFDSRQLAPGSSPRLRGTPFTAAAPRPAVGIIPALAGNTHPPRSWVLLSGDHPRACGEHDMYDNVRVHALGSSPRLRGTPRRLQHRRRCHGIIPALAGNTTVILQNLSADRDHPRACGEHIVECFMRKTTLGSSPRLRGTLERANGDGAHDGIIPALAGNTLRDTECRVRGGDHPRACGEHIPGLFHKRFRLGSSPRLRGTLSFPTQSLGGLGIIPALAGNTKAKDAIGSWLGDHPRACGEHVSSPSEFRFARGSSPRLRGTRAKHR